MARLKRRSITDRDGNKRRARVWSAWIPKPGGGLELKSTGCTDRKAAEVRAGQMEREALDPDQAASARALTKDLVADYLASRERLGRSAGTMHHNLTKSKHLVRLLPARAADVTHARLVDYIEARLHEGSRRTTIKKELRVFGATWKLALRNGLVEKDPRALVPELDDDYSPGERALDPWEIVGYALVLRPARAAYIAFSVAVGADPAAVPRARLEDIMWADPGTKGRPAGERHAPAIPISVHVRGTKRDSRDRIVPLTTPWQRALVVWAVKHADGVNGKLFTAWANVGRDVPKASEQLGIPSSSPNDWRRTFGTWLRGAGVEPQLIGAAMGHADSRMVERVYGRLPADALAKLLTERTGHLPDTIDALTVETPSDSSECARIENPRVGGSIPSLGTEKTGETRTGDVTGEGPSRALVAGPPDTYRTADDGDGSPVLPVGGDGTGAECSPCDPDETIAAWRAWFADVHGDEVRCDGCGADLLASDGAVKDGARHLCLPCAGEESRPNVMDALDGPVCGCGLPSRFEDGWCGSPHFAGRSVQFLRVDPVAAELFAHPVKIDTCRGAHPPQWSEDERLFVCARGCGPLDPSQAERRAVSA